MQINSAEITFSVKLYRRLTSREKRQLARVVEAVLDPAVVGSPFVAYSHSDSTEKSYDPPLTR